MFAKILMMVVFIAAVVAIGLSTRKHSGSVEGFVLGGRNVGPWLSAFAYGTSYFSAVIFVGYAGQFGWKYGMSATWIGVGNAFIGSLLAWVVLGQRTRRVTHRLGAATMPQFFGTRYGSEALRVASAAIIFVFLIPYTASVYNGLSRLFEMAFGIDYTDHMRSDNEAFGRFFLNIQRAQRGRKFGEGHVDYISVIDYRGAQPVEYICRNIAGRELKLGRNDFTIPAFHAGHFSASSVSPLSNDGTAKAGKYYIVRTASGHYAKVRFDGSADALQMKYKMIR